MNENNESTQNSGAEFEFSPVGTETLEPPVKTPKSGGSKKIIAAVLACAVVAGGIFAVRKLTTPDPETVVKEAFTATVADQKASAEKIYEKLPALKKVFSTEAAGASDCDFDFKIKSVDGIEQAALINAVISNSGLRGCVKSDPSSASMLFDGEVYLKDKTIADAIVYASPDSLVMGVPSFYDKLISVNPKTIAADYKASIFNEFSPMDDKNLETVQQLVTGEIEYIRALSTISPDKMMAEISPIFSKAAENAAYSYDKANNKYVVALPGADVKTAIVAYYRYIYFDSEIGEALSNMLSPILSASGESDYASVMNEVISQIENGLPEMDTVLSLGIENKLIKTVNMVCTPAAPAAASSAASSEASSAAPESAISFGTITADMTIDSMAAAMNMKMDITGDGEAVGIVFDCSSKFENDVYAVDFGMNVDSDSVKMPLKLTYTMAADNSYGCDMSMDVTSQGETVKAAFASKGTIAVEGDTIKSNTPDASISCNYENPYGSGSFGLTFDYTSTTAPLSEKLSAPAGSTALFSMTEQEFSDLMNAYYAGGQSVVGMFYSALIGG